MFESKFPTRVRAGYEGPNWTKIKDFGQKQTNKEALQTTIKTKLLFFHCMNEIRKFVLKKKNEKLDQTGPEAVGN